MENSEAAYLLKNAAFLASERTGIIVQKAVEMAVNALEKTQWVPVSKRLPEDLQEVNITFVNHRPESYYKHIKDKPFNGSAVYFKGKWYWYSQYCVDTLKEYGYCESDEMDDAIEVTAWLPLPDPWEGG